MTHELAADDFLQWRDLDAIDVYQVAHYENRFRDEQAQYIAKVAGIGKPDLIHAAAHTVQVAYTGMELTSDTWLRSQASILGKSVERDQVQLPMADTISPQWMGERIRFARQKAGMSQSALAQQFDVTSSYISRLESGTRGLGEKASLEEIFAAIATAHELEGDEAEAYVTNNVAVVVAGPAPAK